MARGPFLSSLAEMMEWGLRGPVPSRRRALALRLAAILAFLALWSLASGTVVVFRLFNPIFLSGPWLVIGKIVQLAASGQLWGHVAATLGRVAIGFATGALAALALGLPAGYFRRVRDLVEPVVEIL